METHKHFFKPLFVSCLPTSHGQSKSRSQTQNQGVGKPYPFFRENHRTHMIKNTATGRVIMQSVFHTQYITFTTMIVKNQKPFKKIKSSRGQYWDAEGGPSPRGHSCQCTWLLQELDEQFQNFSLHQNPWRCCCFIFFFLFVLPNVLHTEKSIYKIHLSNVKNNKS